MHDGATSSCDVCNREFVAKFRYQVREDRGRFVYACSLTCHEALLRQGVACSVCSKPFELEYPWQIRTSDRDRKYFCTQDCLAHAERAVAPKRNATRRIAVFNHKGGTGKTTTAINLAAAFADRGRTTLLVDADGQGNVGVSLGIRGEKSFYHVLVNGLSVEDAAVPVRSNLDVLTSNETLAAAEIYLAGRPNRDRVMRERMGGGAQGWEMVVLDCAPALSLMNQNALVYAEGIVIPVSCDYLSLVGVKQVLKTVRNVRDLLRHDVRILGVLPTFYDARNRICRDAVDALRQHFGERCLPPIRVNTKLREAPGVRQTIFEYAPESHGARDYLAVVDRLFELENDADGAESFTAKVASRPPAVVAQDIPVYGGHR